MTDGGKANVVTKVESVWLAGPSLAVVLLVPQRPAMATAATQPPRADALCPLEDPQTPLSFAVIAIPSCARWAFSLSFSGCQIV